MDKIKVQKIVLKKIIKSDKLILDEQAKSIIKSLQKNKDKYVFDFKGLDGATSRCFCILADELYKMSILEKSSFINFKENIWQYKLDEAIKYATDNKYREMIDRLWYNASHDN